MSEQTQTQISTQETVPQVPEVDSATGKLIYTYQPVDSENKPIGRAYRLLYTDQNDLVQQLTQSQINAARWIHEVKEGKRQIKGEQAVPRADYKPKELSTDETFQKTLDLQNPTESRKALRELIEAEIGAPIEEVRSNLQKARDLEEHYVASQWAMQNEAKGYYICPENAQAITKYLHDNNLRLSASNLDAAFEDLKGTLVPIPSELPVKTPEQAPVTEQKRTVASTSIVPGQFGNNRQSPRGNNDPLSSERFRTIERMSLPETRKLQRNSPAEWDAFLKMKYPTAS